MNQQYYANSFCLKKNLKNGFPKFLKKGSISDMQITHTCIIMNVLQAYNWYI